MNVDRYSERDEDMLGEDYEKNWDNMKDLSFSRQMSKPDDKDNLFEKGSIEDILQNSTNFYEFD